MKGFLSKASGVRVNYHIYKGICVCNKYNPFKLPSFIFTLENNINP